MAHMPNRLLADLQRRTLVPLSDGQCLPMPSEQFWYERAMQTVWWDLDLLYQKELRDKSSNQTRSKWCKTFQSRVEEYMPAGVPYFIRENFDAGVRIV